MISALRKIERSAATAPDDLRTSKLGQSFAFAMISDGVPSDVTTAAVQANGHAPSKKGQERSLWQKVTSVLRTHPPMDERIAALEKAAEAGLVPSHNPASASSRSAWSGIWSP